MVELTGSLTGIGFAAIAELMVDVHHSGRLDLRKGSSKGTLAFDNGRLVAADHGDHHGLQALADCIMEFGDGDFTFTEGEPPVEHTLDVGPSDLKKLVDRISSGEFEAAANGVNGSAHATDMGMDTCPMLGFADDRANHYSRPTALHRCYAGGATALVTAPEQRELCLSHGFSKCPRYINATTERVVASGPPIATADPPHSANVVSITEPPTAVAEPSPRGAAVRAAKPAAAPAPVRETPVVAARSGPQLAARGPSRSALLVLAGAMLGFVLAALLILVLLPAVQRVPDPQLNETVEPVVSQPTPALPPAIATAPAPVSVAELSRTTSVTSPTALPRLIPTAQPEATVVVPVSGHTLMDARFASGPRDDWLSNAPYAAWADGAFRMSARDRDRFVAVGIPLDRVVGDVVVAATLRKTGGPPGGGYGLILRDQGPEPRDGINQQMTAYVFATGDVGQYGVWRRDGDHWVDLVPWTPSASVRAGGSPNVISVRASGDAFTFTVNGVDLATIHDDALGPGGVGLFVGGDNNEVALDHFSVQLPD